MEETLEEAKERAWAWFLIYYEEWETSERYRKAWLSARKRANRLQKTVDELSAPRIYEENEENESLERIEST